MAKTRVRSLRLPEELWAWIEARAKQRDKSVNAWMLDCIEITKRRLEPR